METDRYVMVLDISGSMKTDGRIVQLRQAARTFISTARDKIKIGLVQFNSRASVVATLTMLGNNADRQSLISLLPGEDAPGGDTSIGAGLLKGIEVLGGLTLGDGKVSKDIGGIIVLVTDGQETTSPYIADVQPSLIAAKVTVHSIGIGSGASMLLENLASDTEGSSFFASAADAGLVRLHKSDILLYSL